MRYFLLFVTLISMGPLLFSQTRDTRIVAVQSEDVKESSSNFARSLGSLVMGDSVRLASDDGRWANVSTDTLSGWVRSSSLSSRRILPAGTSTATAAEIALAGKGFSPDIELEYRRNGLDFSMVDSMERVVILPQELLNFIREGHLSGGE